MSYLQKTIGEFTPGTAVNDADLIPYEQGGITKRIPFSTFKGSIPNYGYLTGTFDSTDLSANILTLNHAKNTRAVRLTIYNPAGILMPLLTRIDDSNNVSVDMGGFVEGGDFEYLLEYWTGVGATYPDPVYQPAGNYMETVWIGTIYRTNGAITNFFGAGVITISSKTGTGKYELQHSLGHDNFFITAHVFSAINDAAGLIGVKTIIQSPSLITIYTSDDATPNDASIFLKIETYPS